MGLRRRHLCRLGWPGRLGLTVTIGGLAVLVMLAVAHRWRLNPEAVVRQVEAVLTERLGAEVRINRARINGLSEIALESVHVGLPDRPGPEGRLFYAARAVAQFDLSSLLERELVVTSLRLERPVLHLTERLDGGGFTWEQLRMAEPGDPEEDTRPHRWPNVQLVEGWVQFGAITETGYQRREVLPVSGFASRTPADPDRYGFRLRDRASGMTVDGWAALDRPAMEIQLDGRFELDSRYGGLLPSAWRGRWKALQPTGGLRDVAIVYDGEGEGLKARLAFEDLGLTAPLGEEGLHLRGGRGELVLAASRVELEAAGEIAGMRGELALRGESLQDDGPFEAELAVQGVIPEAAGWSDGLPKVVRDQLDRFSPAGPFRFAGTFVRTVPGGEVDYDAVLELEGLEATYHRFAYPVSDLHGKVSIRSDRVSIEGVRGRGRGDSVVIVSGEITPPGVGAQVDLRIIAREIPVEPSLVGALDADKRRYITMFTDDAIVRSWRNSIALLAGEDGELRRAAAAFEPGGAVDVDVTLHRPLGRDARYRSTTRIDLAGVDLMFRHCPYPLHAESGQVVVAPDGLAVHAELSSPLGATGRVQGEFIRPGPAASAPAELPPGMGEGDGEGLGEGEREADAFSPAEHDAGNEGSTPGGVWRPDLNLEMKAPVGPGLLAILPEAYRPWVQSMGPSGIAAVTGRIEPGEGGGIDWSVALDPGELELRPQRGSLELRTLAGEAVLRPDGLKAQQLTATVHDRQADAAANENAGDDRAEDASWRRIEARDVAIDWSDPTNVAYRGRLIARGMPLERPWLDLVPEAQATTRARLESLHATYQPEGVTDLELRLDSRVNGLPSFEASPRNLAFDWQDGRIALRGMQGRVTRDAAGRWRFEELAGRFGDAESVAGRLVVSGEAASDGSSGELMASVSARSIDATLRAAAPRAVVELIDTLEFKGGYDLERARLAWSPPAPAPARQPGQDAAPAVDGAGAGDAGGDAAASDSSGADDVDVAAGAAPGGEAAAIAATPRWSFGAALRLHDARATVGVPLTGLDADLTVEVEGDGSASPPRITVDVQAPRLRALDRELTKLQATLANADHRETLEVAALRAEMAGGALVGKAAVQLVGDDHGYRAQLTLADALLPRLLEPSPAAESREDPRAATRGGSEETASSGPDGRTAGSAPSESAAADDAGPATEPTPDAPAPPGSEARADAAAAPPLPRVGVSLALQGQSGQPASKQGRGVITVRGDRLIDVPLVLPLLDVLSLSIPSSRSFDRAEATFRLSGDAVRFDHLALESPSLEIVGDGEMDWKSGALELRLYTHDPAQPRLGPLQDIVSKFKDELVQIEVGGTWQDPEPRAMTLGGIRRTLKQIFKRDATEAADR